MAKKRVGIVDDHGGFRSSLRKVIEAIPGYQFAGEASDAKEGETLACESRLDILVVDLSLPDRSGIQLTRYIKQQVPDCRIVIVSMHAKIDYIVGALRAGAAAYLVKESVTDCLAAAFEAVLQGEWYLDPALSSELVPRLMDTAVALAEVVDSKYGQLTPREQEIFRLCAQGVSAAGIAEQLFISPKTVQNHRANIMAKLQLHSSADLVRYAARIGLLDE